MSDRSPSSEPKRRRTLSIIEEARVEPSGSSSDPRPTADRVPMLFETDARNHDLLGASLTSSERTSETASASDPVATSREHSPATRASSVPAPMEIDSEEEAFHDEIMSDTTDESDDDYMYGDEVKSNESEPDPFDLAKEQTSVTPSGVDAWVKSVASDTTGSNTPAGNSSGNFQCAGLSSGSGAGGADNGKRRHGNTFMPTMCMSAARGVLKLSNSQRS
ncbi:hypothetical protein D7B24_002248 [Verticillium nonalfalfae]|uniref:Uncharacterized protein n=1 Tax=Verticillium nonalfalfae TaxID=1051616 RepID=A0A3M9XZA5_9PEZI|nr:uncharacterized protein D7B24_002248 [Verticillium nonalfalfae]RNJ53205.1 hypothetical protein D7B24_002248 [Verticillium nonalfalfae]